jgi:hypothetical protein
MTEAMQAVIHRWSEDPSFRQAMRTDHEAALRDAGIELDDDTTGQLRSVDWTQSDAELEEQLEKKLMC